MTEELCGVCRSPREPGAVRCANCGAPLAGAQPSFVASVTKSGSGRSVAILLGVGVLVCGVVTSLVLAGAKSTGSVGEVAAPPQEPVEEVASPREEVPAPVEPPLPEAATEVPPSGDSQRDAPSAESVTLQFNARVASAKGKTLPKGAKCQVNVHVVGASVEDLDVACGTTVLYDSRTPLNGMASYGSDLFERRKGTTWVYRLLYTDIGARTSRSQASVNSTSKNASVFSEGADAFRVELVVDEYSQPRSGEPLMDSPPEPAKFDMPLTIVSQSGEPPLLGSGCRLTCSLDEAAEEGLRCKSELRCGGKVLYGQGPSTGFGPCTVREGAIVEFTDAMQTHEDGDPALVLQADARSVKFSDSPSQRDFEVVFEFAK